MTAVAAETGRRTIGLRRPEYNGGGQLAAFLANGHDLHRQGIEIFLTPGGPPVETKTPSLPEMSVRALRDLAGKTADDDLTGDAIRIDTLIAHGGASNVLKLFGTPKPVGEGGKIHEVEFPDKSKITAYDGAGTIVLVDGETHQSHMLNGAILRDVRGEERRKGEPRGREILFPLQVLKVVKRDGSDPEHRNTATTLTIRQGGVNVSHRDSFDFLDYDSDGFNMASSLPLRRYTIEEGYSSRWRDAQLRDYTDVPAISLDIDPGTIRKKVDEGVESADALARTAWGGLLDVVKKNERRDWPTTKGDPHIEGITPGVSIAVTDALENIEPYAELFTAMGAQRSFSRDSAAGTRTTLVEFPPGSLVTNTNMYPDDMPLSPDSRLVGWGQVRIKVAEDTTTGERNASLLLSREEVQDREEVDLSKAQVEVTHAPTSDIGLGLRYVIPGSEEGQAERVIDVSTAVKEWKSSDKKGTAFFSKITDIFKH